MQIGADQGVLLAFLVRLIGARRAIEIGTFTGYSALAVASALPPDGHARLLRRQRRVDADRAPLLGARPASPTGSSCACAPAQRDAGGAAARHGAGTFDFAFIDADKTGYDALLRGVPRAAAPGGLIAIDNMLWSGAVADPADTTPDTVALRALNAKIRDDPRVDACLLTVGDGVMLGAKAA